MSAFPDTLTPGEQFILEWQYRMLGGFRTALVEAISRADEDNLARLRLGFPDEVDHYLLFTREPGWWPALQARAKVPA